MAINVNPKGVALCVAGFVISQVSDYLNDKKLDDKIRKEVAEAVANATQKES